MIRIEHFLVVLLWFNSCLGQSLVRDATVSSVDGNLEFEANEVALTNGDGERVLLVTQTMLKAYVQEAITAALAGDEGDSAVVRADALDLEILAVEERVDMKLSTKADASTVPSDEDIVQQVEDLIGEGKMNALQMALSRKLEKTTCACVELNAFPTLVQEVGAVEEDVATLASDLQNLTGHIVDLNTISDKQRECHANGELYNIADDVCEPSVSIHCPKTIPIENSVSACDTILGSRCVATCADGYEGGSAEFLCGITSNWMGDGLKCELPRCKTSMPPGANTQIGTCGDVASGATCDLGCQDGFTALGSLTLTCTSGAYSSLTGRCVDSKSCIGRPDGTYTLNAGQGQITTRCVDGWMIVDPSMDGGWANYVQEYTHYSGAFIWGPPVAKLRSGVYDIFTHWWKLPLTDDNWIAQSPDCQSIGKIGSVYSSTGNYVGCTYWNRNCDMNFNDYECKRCADNYRGQISHGTCTHRDLGPRSSYPWETAGNCGHWWNRLPSIGTNGRWCIAYRPGTGSLA